MKRWRVSKEERLGGGNKNWRRGGGGEWEWYNVVCGQILA